MKKIIRKFWGIALVIMMVSSLFVVSATPAAAADPLKWNYAAGWMYFPGSWWNQYPGSDVVDFTVSSDGMTFYAAVHTALNAKQLFKGTMGGMVWSDLTSATNDRLATTNLDSCDFVAISPDNPDIVVVLDAGGTDTLIYAAASKDGGMNFSDMGTIQGTSTAGNTIAAAYDLDVSPISSGNIYYVAIAGAHGAPALGGSAITATATAAFTDGGDTLDEIYDITYVDQDGNAGNAGTITFASGAAIGATGVVALAAGDTGVQDITALVLDVQNDETTGAFDITTAQGASLGTVVTPFVFTDGGAIGSLGAIYYYNFGAAVGAWHDAVDDFGSATVTPAGTNPVAGWPSTITDFRAVQFSYNFGSDFTVMAVSEEVNAAMRLHIFSLASHKWDTDLNMTAYPVTVDAEDAAGVGVFTVNAASIAMGPEFMGIEEETVITWVAASVLDDGAETGGIYRIDETAYVTDIKEGTGMYSIDYDGTTVVAGAYATNIVYRVTEPAANQPTAASSRSMKRIGVEDGADMVIVHFAGANLFGAKSGKASALSKSTDYGNTWNDFYFMDSSNAPMDDILVSPDGSVMYMAASDGAQASIYRSAAGAVQRVLCVDSATTQFMLRGIPSDANVIYAADKNGTDIYVSTDGGVSRWSRKTTFPGTAINDMAVESATVVYVANGVMVYKSTNSGSLWGDPVDTKIAVGIFNIVSLGDGKLIIGGLLSGVEFSTDGGATWTPTFGVMDEFAAMYVTATGLGATDTIFAASAASTNVYKGPAAFFGEFKSMNAPATGATNNVGIALNQGVLYAIQDDGTIIHSLVPTLSPHTVNLWGTAYVQAGLTMGVAPGSSLQVSASGTSIKLWAINTTFNWVYSFEDIVSLVTPTLNAPADGDLIQIVSTTLADATTVVFSWNRPTSRITAYTLMIAKDADFTEIIDLRTGGTAVASTAPSSIVTAVYTRSPLFPMFNPGETYYWKVAVEQPFNGLWSETRTFTVAPGAASVPEIASPANGSTVESVTPAFSWSPITGATTYRFELAKEPEFALLVYTADVTTSSAALPVATTLERGKTYFWRVKALTPIEGDWSQVGIFTVAEEEPTPSPTPPPTFTIPMPSITVTAPQPTVTVILPTTTPTPVEEIATAYIWAIIIIGAVLVIAVIVLIVRTRRTV